MKQSVLKYGTISGLLMVVLLVTTLSLVDRIGFGVANMTLFFGEILAFAPIYFGVRYYRQNFGDGYMTFWKGFNVGILIVAISCMFYAVCSVILYHWVFPDLADKLVAYIIEQMKIHGAQPKDIAEIQTQFIESKKVVSNPFISGAIAFTDPLEYGIIITLICSFILRKSPPKVEISTLN